MLRLTIAAFTAVMCLSVANPMLSALGAPHQQIARVSQLSFENYAVSPVFKGKPVTMPFDNPEAKEYEPELRESIQKGTNFAGHYVLANGLNRAMGGRDTAAIIDLKTGKVYLPTQLRGYHDQRGAGYIPPRPDGGLHYQADSKLLIIIGRSGGSDGNKGIGRYYYKWENNQLKFLTFVNSPYKSQ
ncbi:MAG: hypothetical protein DSM106950_19340 [Stigonema ocellatum SAG 48.90 = DSM 106950]|nr:hypothetical protein [Stigonema ocellatum SAG 48.90 = DSM 106950]